MAERHLVTDIEASIAIPNTVTGNYTLVLTDAGKVVEMDNVLNRTVTIPPNSSVAFPVGTVIGLFRKNGGTVTVVAGAGVTILSSGGLVALTSQYSEARIRQRTLDEWVLSGDLA